MTPVISKFGYIYGNGVGSHNRALTWEQIGCPHKTLRWKPFSDQPFTNFGRMDILTKHMMLAVEMMGDGWEGKIDSQRTGVVIGTQYGCMAADLSFYNTAGLKGQPSPLLFPYTLPSTALGEIAIHYGLMGPNFCYMTGRSSYKTALWEAVDLVQNKQCNTCLCIAGDAILPDTNFLAEAGETSQADLKNAAFAWLIQAPDSDNAVTDTPVAHVQIDSDTPCSGLFSGENKNIMLTLIEFLQSNDSPGEKMYICSPENLIAEKTMTIINT